MNPKEAIEKIKKMLTRKEQKFAEVTLKDGSILKYEGEELAVGTAVTVTVDSAEQPAPDGDYELADGTILTVKEGKVEVITPAAPDEATEQLMRQVEGAIKKVFETFSAEKSKEINTLKDENKNLKQAFSELTTVVEGIINLPAGNPTKKVHSAFKQVDRDASLKTIAEALKGIQEKNKAK